MSNELPPIWDAEPHTIAKHKILASYLDAWSPIMSHQFSKNADSSKVIRFIDAFAGPGIYSGGEDGSPILAIKSVINRQHTLPVPLHCLFIEKDVERFKHLKKSIALLEVQINKSQNIIVDPPINDCCINVLNKLLDDSENGTLRIGPALVFLDQFGYSDVPMKIITRIMSNPQCEVLTYLNYSGLNRFITDESKDDAKTSAFGNEDWKIARDFVEKKRSHYLLNLYKENLSKIANVKYVWDFAMSDSHEKLLYWLFFCTNSLRGLEEIKKAMWRVDDKGTFKYSDSDDPTQLSLFESYNDEWLSEKLSRVYSGKTVTVNDVKLFVFTQTPCYKYATALRTMQRKKMFAPISSKKRISYNNDLDIKLKFADALLFN